MADKKIAEKKSSAGTSKPGTNKSEEIRKVAKTMQEKGEKPRPVTIIAVLAKQGIEVSSPQVSMVLKRMGFRPRKRATSSGTAAKTAVRVKGGALSVDDLLAAKRLVGHFGGSARAIAAIEALQKFES
jgi:transposase